MTAPTTKPNKYGLFPEIVKRPIYVAWVTFAIILLVSTIYYFISQPELPMFYSLANKNDQLAQKEFLFIFPSISFLMNIIHLSVIRILKNYSSLILRLFVITTTILQLIFLISLLRIVIITI